MKRSWLAVTLLAVGSVAILLVWFGFGGDRSGHVHADEASSVIAGAVAGAPVTTSSPDATLPAGSTPADGHAGHLTGAAGSIASAAADRAGPSAAPADPDASAADRRQVSLGEAAGGGSVPSTTALVPVADKWLDPGAAGVNDGSKRQAAGVDLQPAPVVNPADVLPSGLVNGCVAGYGRGVQCLPTTPPSHAGHGSGRDMSMYWTCTEARTVLPDGIVVDTPGTDPLGLDGNQDGTACGAGDR